MLEITLVADEHDDNVGVGMVPEFLQPPHHIGVRGMLGDIVHQQRTDCTTVVSIRDPVSPTGREHAYERTDAEVIARYRSCPAVSQICALTVLPSTLMDRVANSTPIVDFESKLNSFRVKRESTARIVNMYDKDGPDYAYDSCEENGVRGCSQESLF